MIVVVNDANILIDLVKLGLEPHLFGLDMHFHTTNLILEELTEDQQAAIRPTARFALEVLEKHRD